MRSGFCNCTKKRLISESWLLAAYCCYVILDGAIAIGGLNEDRFEGVHDDPIGFVRVVREQESSLRKEGTEWVEGEIVGVIESTFDKDRTFRETIHLRPVFPGINPRNFSCWVRDLNKRIVQFFVCDAEKRSIDGTRHVYLYDTHGRLIENRVENLTEPVSTGERTVYEYDSIGQKTGARTYNSDGALATIETYHPDREKNLVITELRTAAGEFQAKEAHMLDSRGRTIEVVSFDQHGGVLSKTHMSYDDHGKRVERVGSGQGGNVREIDSYEYDERGNWTKKIRRIIRTSGEERTVTRRAIEYYPD